MLTTDTARMYPSIECHSNNRLTIKNMLEERQTGGSDIHTGSFVILWISVTSLKGVHRHG